MTRHSVMLGEVCTVRSSLVDPTQPENSNLPHIAPDNIERDTGRLLLYRTVAEDGVKSGKYRFESGDLLYSKIRPNLNKLTVVDFAGLCSADMYALRVDESRVAVGFLAHLLRGRRFLDFATTLSNRANIPKLNRAQLLGFRFDLPSLDEQRRIAALLDQADAVRVKRRQSVALLDELLASLFAKSLRKAKGLPLSLQEAGVDFQAGKNIVGTEADAHPQRRVIKVSAVSRGFFDPRESKPLPRAYEPPISHRIRSGDILFGRASGSLELLGATVQVDNVPDEVFLPDKVWRAVVRRGGSITPAYLLGILQSHRFREFVQHNASGAAGLRNIGKNKVLEYELTLPSLEDQESYELCAREIRTFRRSQALHAEKLDELFASVETRAFAGPLS